MRNAVVPAVLPPGPKGHFLSGHLADLRRDALAFYTRCAREYGDIASLRFGPARIYVLSHPDLIEEVLVTRAAKGMSLAVRTGFPTCALGVYSFKAERWTDVTAGSAKLVAMMAPPYGG